jgi:hypothetical protein
VLVNLDAVPAWTVVLAEILGLGVLGVTGWFIVKPSYRRRIPVALGVLVVLALVQTAIQERGWRVGAWLIDAVGLTFALSALGRHGGPFAKYRRIEEKYGKDSKELKAYAAKLALRMVIIVAVLLVLAAVLIKGAYSQGT